MRKCFGVFALSASLSPVALPAGKAKAAAAPPFGGAVAAQTTAHRRGRFSPPRANHDGRFAGVLFRRPPRCRPPDPVRSSTSWPRAGKRRATRRSSNSRPICITSCSGERPTEGSGRVTKPPRRPSTTPSYGLWGNNLLDNLSVDARDYTFSNGVIGKLIIYNMEERQRIKFGPDFVGSKQLDTTKIDEKLKEANLQIHLDTFVDAGLVKKVAGVVADMMKEKGFQNANVTPDITEVPGGPKLVHLTYNIDEGPKIKINSIQFLGNQAISSGKLKRQMKDNKERIIWVRMFAGRSTYQEAKFDDDAEKVIEYYKDRGYITVRVGAPELKLVRDSDDKKTRFVDLDSRRRRQSVQGGGVHLRRQHGRQERRPAADVQGRARQVLQRKDGSERSRESARGVRLGRLLRVHRLPRFQVPDLPDAAESATPDAGTRQSRLTGPPVSTSRRSCQKEAVFVNRLTFTGNTTTRDKVIRREVGSSRTASSTPKRSSTASSG